MGTRDLFAYGGLAAGAPRMQALMMMAAMAALGLPGLSGFAGEFLILIGTWQTQPVYTAISLIAIVLASAYMLRLLQHAMHGPLRLTDQRRQAQLPTAVGGVPIVNKELRVREIATVAPLLAAIVLLGIWPTWVIARTANPQQSAASASVEAARS
jgi:NADH-quinone oxidoreductase subunit M